MNNSIFSSKTIGTVVGLLLIGGPIISFLKFTLSTANGNPKAALYLLAVPALYIGLPIILLSLLFSKIRRIVFWLFPYLNLFNLISNSSNSIDMVKINRKFKKNYDYKNELVFKLITPNTNRVAHIQTMYDINKHICCFGGSGKGKTFSFGRPILTFLLLNRPGILMDPKGDLAPYANGCNHKHPIIYFNPDDPQGKRI